MMINFSNYIGKSKRIVIESVEKDGYEVRVVREDDKWLAGKNDVNERRINLVVDHNKVREMFRG